MKKEVEKLSVKECYALQALVHKRLCALAGDKDENRKAARLCRKHETATVQPSGGGPELTGTILTVENGCVELQFADDVRRWVEAVRLTEDGFDREITPAGPVDLDTDTPPADAPVLVDGHVCTITKAGRHSVTVRQLAPAGPPYTVSLQDAKILKPS